LVLFLFQSYLEGFTWFGQNLWIGSAILLSGLTWILLLTLLSQTISAWVKWRMAASAALIAVYLIPSVFSEVINLIFGTKWGNIISVQALGKNVTSGLFGTFVKTSTFISDFGAGPHEVIVNEPPLWCSWLALCLICGLCLALLSRKLKAYEVVR
jgi:hypothetical protein